MHEICTDCTRHNTKCHLRDIDGFADRRQNTTVFFAQTTKKAIPTRAGLILPFFIYAAFCKGAFAALSIFSMKIPYPVVGSPTSTCVTAPTILPF